MLVKQAQVKNNEIEINFFGRDKGEWTQMLSNVKSLPGRTFDANSKRWKAPRTEANLQSLQSWGFSLEQALSEIEVVKEPEQYVEPWKDLEVNAPEYLRPYQVDAMRFLSWSKGRGLLGSDPGAGKTIMALAFLQMTQAFPALIVVPATIKIQWQNQFKKFLGDKLKVEILWGQTPYQLRKGYTYIINWDILHHWKESLREIEFKTLIGDECHRISNTKSQRAKALKMLSRHIPNFIPMSGTPIKSRPAQFYSVLNILDPETFKSEWNFLQKYCGPKHNGFGWTFTGATNLPELYKIIRPYMLRQEKKDILKDLPPRQLSVIPLDISENKEYYEASLQKFKEASGLDAQQAFSNLKLEAFALKQDFLVKWLEEFLETGEKILVGTYHRRVIEFLYEKFKGNCRYIYGGMTPKQREEAIQTFIQKDDCQILFGQILAAGEGIDGLQEVSSNVVFVEFANTPADHDQFASRLHRSGQKDSVNEYYLIASGTVEDDMVESLNAKNKTFEALVNGREVEENAFIDIVKMKIKGM